MDIISRFKLDGKKALVTGGGRGLGRAFAIALAEAGADVAIIDINNETAKAVSQEIKSLGRKSIHINADVNKVSDVFKMVDKVTSLWSKIDIAINNAGESHLVEAKKLEERDWDKIIDLDLKGTLFCAQAEAKAMIPNKYGKIINIASIAGYKIYSCGVNDGNYEYQCSYSIAKAGVVHLTRCLAVEWAKYGIRVNCISPGFTNAPVLKENRFKDVLSTWINSIPMRRLAEVEDLQGAIIYLSSEISDYMTGQDLIIDGGFVLV